MSLPEYNNKKFLHYSLDSAEVESMVRVTSDGSWQSVDVIEDYRWTLSPIKNSVLKDKIPRIILTEYQMTQNMLTNGVKYYTSNIQKGLKQIKEFNRNAQNINHFSNSMNSKDDSYEGLFDYESPTGYQYVFPYYNEDNFSISSTWANSDAIEKSIAAASTVAGVFGAGAKDAVKSITDVIEGVAGIAQGVAGIAYPKTGFLDKPKIWGETTHQSVTISFYLFNTFDSADIFKNWQLCNHLCHQNLYSKITFITAYPPVFYRVEIPGQYSSIGSNVSNLKISNVGNVRRMKLGDLPEVNVPDAYLITMTLEDMVMPSRNLLNRISQKQPKVTTQTR